MLRALLGWIILLHALAHVSAGTWTTLLEPAWFTTALWTITFGAYFGAGLGVLRLPGLRHHWKNLLVTGTFASLALIVWMRPAWGLIGAAIDVTLLVLGMALLQPRIDSDIAVVDAIGTGDTRHPRWVRTGWALGIAALVYGSMVLAAHPVIMRWGTTPVERGMTLPGDDVLPADALYRIDHGITIHAPANAVWPWLVQLGQDRGGFYSYDWLERAIGDRIRNADRIDPAWQHRAVGDTIFATQRDYFGGRFGALGWQVTTLEPNRVIGLANWGNFVLTPVDSTTTRLIVRTRGSSHVTWIAFVLTPFNVFVFEPAHFIMERGMLRGIRDRAERATRASRSEASRETPDKKPSNSALGAGMLPDGTVP